MSRITDVIKRMYATVRADSEKSPFEVIEAYKKKFGSVPTLVGVPVPLEKMVAVLSKALESDKALTEDEWYKALGVKAPPSGVLT